VEIDMHPIKTQTLLVAIQGVDRLITELEIELENSDGPDAADLEVVLLQYTNAAADLKAQYNEARKTASNLPAYDSLARNT
jgi:hypothetical protein